MVNVMQIATVALALAMLVLSGATGASAAKRCRLLCKEQVRACVADARARIVCTERHGHDRRDCQRELHVTIRACKSIRGPILSGCKTATSTDTCSPSGAFIDGVSD
jgi:hypothetical protein